MAFQTNYIQIDGSINVDGSIFQNNTLFEGGDNYWDRTGSTLSPATSTDHIQLGAAANLQLGGVTNTYITGSFGGNISYYIGGSVIQNMTSSNIVMYKPLSTNITDTVDIGTNSSYFRDIYAQKWYVDDTSTSISNVTGDLTFTDINAGTKTLSELASGGGGGDVQWASGNVGSDNQVITAAGDGSIVSESGLTWNGTTLDVNGGGEFSGTLVTNHIRPNSNGTYDVGAGTSSNYYRSGYFSGTVYADDGIQLNWESTPYNITPDTAGSGFVKSSVGLMCDTYFASSDNGAVLGTSSAGVAYMRPTSYNSSSNQFTVDQNGTSKQYEGAAIGAEINAQDFVYSGSTQETLSHGFIVRNLSYQSNDYQGLYYNGTTGTNYGGLFHRQGTSYSDLRQEYNYWDFYIGSTGGSNTRYLRVNSSGLTMDQANSSILNGEYDLTIGGGGSSNGGDVIIRSAGGSTTPGHVYIYPGSTAGTRGNTYINGDNGSNFGVAVQFYAGDATTERMTLTADTLTVAATLSMNLHDIDMNGGDVLDIDEITHTSNATGVKSNWENASTELYSEYYDDSPNTWELRNGIATGTGGTVVFQVDFDTGLCRSANDVVAYYSFSDERLKTNIKNIENISHKLRKIKPITFNWKDGAVDNKTHFGFIAQQVEPYFPETVTEDLNVREGKEFKRIRYDEFAPILTKAFQEQQEKIESQDKTIKSLEDRIDKLEKLIKEKI